MSNRWQLPHIAERLFNQPHAITPQKLKAVVWALRDRIGADLGEPPAEAMQPAASNDHGYSVRQGVAVIPVHGTLVQRGDSLDAESGLVGYNRLANLVEAAEANGSVNAVLLDIDSGGGEVAGALDAADRINDIAQRIPMAALANENACSAAYLIAAATGRVWTTQSAAGGSIGVIMAHMDQTQRNAERGVVVTELFAGARKADGSPHHELGEEEQARLQSFIDGNYNLLVSKVALFRGVSEQSIRDTEAGVFLAPQLIDRGLADAIHTLDSAVQALMPTNAGGRPMAKTKRNKVAAGENLAATLEELIQQQTSDDRTSQDVQEDMAQAAGIDPSTVDGILSGEINCPPLERLEGFAEVLDTSTQSLRESAEQDGCDYSEGSEAKAPCCSTKAADPADVARVCAEAGFPEQAEDLIRRKASMDEVQNQVNAIGTMRERANAAVSAGMLAQGKVDALIKSARKQGKTPDEFTADMFDLACKAQTADSAVQSQITPDSGTKSEAAHSWDDVYSKV